MKVNVRNSATNQPDLYRCLFTVVAQFKHRLFSLLIFLYLNVLRLIRLNNSK